MNRRNEGDRYMDGRSEKGKKSGGMEATGGKDKNVGLQSLQIRCRLDFYLCKKETFEQE